MGGSASAAICGAATAPYEDMLPGVVLLLEQGVAREERGAIWVFLRRRSRLSQNKDALHRAQEGRRALCSTSVIAIEEGLEVEPGRRQALACSVGIGAVKCADLSQNRLSNYRFDWD